MNILKIQKWFSPYNSSLYNFVIRPILFCVTLLRERFTMFYQMCKKSIDEISLFRSRNTVTFWFSDTQLRENWTSSKHYENMPIQIYWKFYHPKSEKKNQIKILILFHVSAQYIDFGYSLEPPRRGGSNEYPQSMFWGEIRKIMPTPVNPSFTI